jgi:hypothetical protein
MASPAPFLLILEAFGRRLELGQARVEVKHTEDVLGRRLEVGTPEWGKACDERDEHERKNRAAHVNALSLALKERDKFLADFEAAQARAAEAESELAELRDQLAVGARTQH